ncbi:MAG TPA: hypothetical protein VL172_02985 [Kofleriaceae bacterium]|nr:hypothetical protein [Kofleriaceae bacterium]
MRRWLLPGVLVVVLGAVVGYLAWKGWDYYRLPLERKPEHPDFRSLRPSGSYGHGLGMLGGVLVFANLLYLVRRRLQGYRLGPMPVWLDLHAFTGLLAAALIAFHSAFQLRSQLATITSISLAVVVLTGVIGRFLHALLPADARLMRSWRGMHRLFAILMLVTVVVHVAVAWHYGYRWRF